MDYRNDDGTMFNLTNTRCKGFYVTDNRYSGASFEVCGINKMDTAVQLLKFVNRMQARYENIGGGTLKHFLALAQKAYDDCQPRLFN